MEFAVNNCLFSWLLSTTSSCVAALANPISLNVPFLYFFVGMCCGVCPCFVVIFFLSIWQLHHWGPNVSGTVVVSFEALLCHCMWHSVVLLAWFRLLVSLCSILEALCMGHRLFSFLLQFLWFIIIVFRFNQLMPLDGESVSRRISYYLVLVLQDPGSQTLQRCTLSFRFLNFHGFCMMYHSIAFSEAG